MLSVQIQPCENGFVVFNGRLQRICVAVDETVELVRKCLTAKERSAEPAESESAAPVA